jgi:GTPase SAR1 family protein
MIPSLLSDQQKLFLLARLLKAPDLQQSQLGKCLVELKATITDEFKPLASKDSFPEEIEVYEDILHVLSEIEDVSRFPLLCGRHIVAVGGAFSAGKSSFVNSFLKNDILPTAIERTTALPTYIVNAPVEAISACALSGRVQQLTNADFNFLTHTACRDFGISLSTFLRYLSLSTPVMPYKNIAFLDTPGYSADPRYGERLSDEMIAEESLRGADTIVWCVDTDNGNVRQTDIQFLHRLGHNRRIFIVFTKADLKDPTDLAGMKDLAMKTLTNAGVAVEGVAMYSAHYPEEYPAAELNQFLNGIDHCKKSLVWREAISKSIHRYVNYHENSKNELKRQRKILNDIDLFMGVIEEEDHGKRSKKNQASNKINGIRDELLNDKNKEGWLGLIQDIFKEKLIYE